MTASIASRAGAWSRHQAARLLVARALGLHVAGLEHVPASGSAILVARHYHRLYDAAAILACVPREVHVLIAVDWLGTGLRLRLMRWLAAAARWPAVWRSGPGWRLNRDGYQQSLRVLREGRLLLVSRRATRRLIRRARGRRMRTDFGRSTRGSSFSQSKPEWRSQSCP